MDSNSETNNQNYEIKETDSIFPVTVYKYPSFLELQESPRTHVDNTGMLLYKS
jgi:hypothetical protein